MIRKFDTESLEKIKEYCNDDEVGNKIVDFFKSLDFLGLFKRKTSDDLGLNIDDYVDNIDDYHKTLIQADNISKDALEEVFLEISNVDVEYSKRLHDINKMLSEYTNSVGKLVSIISSSNAGKGVFTSESVFSECIKDGFDGAYGYAKKLFKNADGTYRYDLIREALSKDKDELSEVECCAIAMIIEELADPSEYSKTLDNLDTFLEEVFTEVDINSNAWKLVSQKIEVDTRELLRINKGVNDCSKEYIAIQNKILIDDIIYMTDKNIEDINSYNLKEAFSFVEKDDNDYRFRCKFGNKFAEIEMHHANLSNEFSELLVQQVAGGFEDILQRDPLMDAHNAVTSETFNKLSDYLASDGLGYGCAYSSLFTGISIAISDLMEIKEKNKKNEETKKMLERYSMSRLVDSFCIGGSVIYSDDDDMNVRNITFDEDYVKERVDNYNNCHENEKISMNALMYEFNKIIIQGDTAGCENSSLFRFIDWNESTNHRNGEISNE